MSEKPELKPCQNMCCPYNTVKLFADPVPPSCATGADEDECGDFTTTPTTSISVAELEKLRADLAKPSEWISVDDRLPEVPGLYLTYDPSLYGVEITMYGTRGFDQHSYPVTHWKPLPSPPDKA